MHVARTLERTGATIRPMAGFLCFLRGASPLPSHTSARRLPVSDRRHACLRLHRFAASLCLGGTLFALSALPALDAHAAQVTFAWDYDDPRATGFMLYCGPTSGYYNIRIDVGYTTSASVSGFPTEDLYYCSVSAYRPGEESALSNEVPFTPVALPVPAFQMNPTSVSAGTPVTFTNTTTGQVASWRWDFGDGTSSTEAAPTHVYDTPGRYTVVLTASGPGGTASTTAVVSPGDPPQPIVVSGANAVMNAVRAAIGARAEAAPPALAFSVDRPSGSAPHSVVFTNSTAGASSWKWDFGDGATSSEHSPPHTYLAAGMYTVTLTASGPGGMSNPVTATITVTASAALDPDCVPSEVSLGDATTPAGTDPTELAVSGQARAFSATALKTCKVGALSVYLGAGSSATRLVVGLYSDAGGEPGALLAQGSTSQPRPGQNIIPIFPTRIQGNDPYWIAILGTPSGALEYHTGGGGCAAVASDQTDLTALPASWSSGSGVVVSCPMAVFGTSAP